jgi:hypothetical protein
VTAVTQRHRPAAGLARRVVGRIALAMALATTVAASTAWRSAAQTDLDTTGGGAIGLTLDYSIAPHTVLQPLCQPTAFAVSGGSQLLVVSVTSAADTGVYDYAGPVSITGTGSSTCEDASEALSGSLSVSLASPTGSSDISCASLAGAYLRIGVTEVLELQGTCVLQGLSFPVSFISTVAYEPLIGDGVLTPVTQASLSGVIHVTA